jgi:hypothetical protein
MTTQPMPSTTTHAAHAKEPAPLAFLLLAVLPGTGVRTIGRYADYDTAAAAQIEDTLRQLENNDGWLTTCEHLIVGPDLDGSISSWPYLVSLGADPASDHVPAPYDRDDWKQWLEQTHQLPS